MKTPRLFPLVLAFACSYPAAALQTFDNKAQFFTATGAVSATGPLPDLGLIASGTVTLGTVTVTAPLATGQFYVGANGVPGVEPDWYPGTPGNDMAFGFEDFEVESATPVHALGFELVEPDVTLPPWGGTPVDSPYMVTLYDNATPVGEFVFNAPDDQLAFVGVWSDQAFNRVTIVDTTGNNDDEYFGEFWSGTAPAQQTVFAPLAASGAAVPGSAGVFTGFTQSPALSFGSAAFLGQGSAGSFGIYLKPSEPIIPGALNRIADLATAIPGGSGSFTGFTNLALAAQPQDPIRVAFTGTGAGQAGVYLFNSATPGAINRIADLATAIPGGSGSFTGFTNLALAAAPQDPFRVAFTGIGAAQAGVYLFNSATPGALNRIADLATPIPGGSGSFTGFTNLALATALQEPIRVAFTGTGAGQAGVYLFNSATPGAINRIADLATPIPGGTGSFTGFTAVSASTQHTAFLGLGAGGQQGIYLASALAKVIAAGDTLSGTAVTDLRLGRDGLNGNRLAFTAHFADGSEGVFSVQVASYAFEGFFPPVDNLPVFNQVMAGKAIPVKFSLNGNQGLHIFAAGYPKSQPIACKAKAPGHEIEKPVNASSSSLSYNAASDKYTYVWKTEKAWANTCRQLVLKLNDGTTHRANFKFK